ncbi:MAG: SpaA isopeptide-forming pilin-related protein [Actinomycetaceae bacterium]|nr:SpaA isopeptide-forming pilin-related protein [Actinomycetaceae bacterium]MDY6082531.1 SpaA isopeptide-forming pilin-related protein [Actinomycetaceae bacterium]
MKDNNVKRHSLASTPALAKASAKGFSALARRNSAAHRNRAAGRTVTAHRNSTAARLIAAFAAALMLAATIFVSPLSGVTQPAHALPYLPFGLPSGVTEIGASSSDMNSNRVTTMVGVQTTAVNVASNEQIVVLFELPAKAKNYQIDHNSYYPSARVNVTSSAMYARSGTAMNAQTVSVKDPSQEYVLGYALPGTSLTSGRYVMAAYQAGAEHGNDAYDIPGTIHVYRAPKNVSAQQIYDASHATGTTPGSAATPTTSPTPGTTPGSSATPQPGSGTGTGSGTERLGNDPVKVQTQEPTTIPGKKCGDVTEVIYPGIVGLTYSTDVVGSDLVVTAQAEPGYVIDKGSTTRWTYPALAHCDRAANGHEVTPSGPIFVEPTATEKGSFTLPKEDGIIYHAETSEANDIVHIEAIPVPGYWFPEGAQTEWTKDLAPTGGQVKPQGTLDSTNGFVYSLASNGDERKVYDPSSTKVLRDIAPTFQFPAGYTYDGLGLGAADGNEFTAFAIRKDSHGNEQLIAYHAADATPTVRISDDVIGSIVKNDASEKVLGGAYNPKDGKYYYATVSPSEQQGEYVNVKIYRAALVGGQLQIVLAVQKDLEADGFLAHQGGKIDVSKVDGDLAFDKYGEAYVLFSDQTMVESGTVQRGEASVYSVNADGVTNAAASVWRLRYSPEGMPKDGLSVDGLYNFYSTNGQFNQSGYMWIAGATGDSTAVGTWTTKAYSITDLAQFVAPKDVPAAGPFQGKVNFGICEAPKVIWAATAIGDKQATPRYVEIYADGNKPDVTTGAPTGRRMTEWPDAPTGSYYESGADIAVSADNKYMYQLGLYRAPGSRSVRVVIKEIDVDQSSRLAIEGSQGLALTDRSVTFAEAQHAAARPYPGQYPKGAIDLGVDARTILGNVQFGGYPTPPINSLSFHFDGNGEPFLLFGGQEGANAGHEVADGPRIYEYNLARLWNEYYTAAAQPYTSPLVAEAIHYKGEGKYYNGWEGDFFTNSEGDLMGAAHGGDIIVFKGVPSTTNPMPTSRDVGYVDYGKTNPDLTGSHGQELVTYGLSGSAGKVYTVAGDQWMTNNVDASGVFRLDQEPTFDKPSTTVYKATEITSQKSAITANKEELRWLPENVNWSASTPLTDMTAPTPSAPDCGMGIQKSFEQATAIAGKDGQYTVDYQVQVINKNSTENAYTLTDHPQFDKALRIIGSATVTREGSGDPIKAAVGQNGVINLTPNGTVQIVGNTTHTYTVSIPVEFTYANGRMQTLADYNTCTSTANGAGKGLFNTATLKIGNKETDAWACGDLPKLSVRKERVVGDAEAIPLGSDGSFEAKYQVVVRNEGTMSAAVPKITDFFQLQAGGLIGQNVRNLRMRVDGADAQQISDNGAYRLYTPADDGSNKIMLDPGESHAFIISVTGMINKPSAITSSQWENLSSCEAGSGSDVHTKGIWNQVLVDDDTDGDTNNWACVPVDANPSATIQVKKVDGEQTTVGLAGAEFAVYNTDPSVAGAQPYVTLVEEDQVGAPGVLTIPEGTANKLVANQDGSAKAYWLVETRAPSGRRLLAEPIRFTVAKAGMGFEFDFSANAKNDFITVSKTNGMMASASVTVANFHKGALPLSGGNGVMPFALVGMAIVGCGLAATARRRIR